MDRDNLDVTDKIIIITYCPSFQFQIYLLKLLWKMFEFALEPAGFLLWRDTVANLEINKFRSELWWDPIALLPFLHFTPTFVTLWWEKACKMLHTDALWGQTSWIVIIICWNDFYNILYLYTGKTFELRYIFQNLEYS